MQVLVQKMLSQIHRGLQFSNKGRLLTAGYFIIEFSYTKRHFYIAAFDLESSNSFIKKLKANETEAIFKDFHNDYNNIASNLQIKGDRIVIIRNQGIMIYLIFRIVKRRAVQQLSKQSAKIKFQCESISKCYYRSC